MNIFYAPPAQIYGDFAELTGGEASHASRVMRAKEGDRLVLVDGQGGRYEGPIVRVMRNSVQIRVESRQHFPPPKPELVLGLGIIKKRDRLEFAVEKAVELGAMQITLFRSEHTIKKKVRTDRLESIALSAMKQSLRSWLPEISVFHSVDKVIAHFSDVQCLLAHEKAGEEAVRVQNSGYANEKEDRLLLLVGPEGGFSSEEVDRAADAGAKIISLGSYRLRAETAAVAFMSQFLS